MTPTPPRFASGSERAWPSGAGAAKSRPVSRNSVAMSSCPSTISHPIPRGLPAPGGVLPRLGKERLGACVGRRRGRPRGASRGPRRLLESSRSKTGRGCPMRRVLAVAALSAAALGVGPAYGDGDEKGGREVRLYETGGLTTQRASFVTDRGPYPTRPDEVNDNARPLYAGETEEGQAVLTGDEIVADVEAALPHPVQPTEERTIESSGGRLTVFATPEDHRRVGERLAALERAGLEAAIVDVLVVEGDVPSGESGLASALASRTARVTAAARASTWLGLRAAASTGTMSSYVADYDVEVAQKSQTVDPIVGVARAGVAFEATTVRSGDRALLDIHGWIARLSEMHTSKTARDDTIEIPVVDGAALHATMRVVPGAWTIVSGTGSSLFAVRVALEPFAASVPQGVAIPSRRGGAPGVMDTDSIPVADLVVGPPSSGAPTIRLNPSNYTPPAPHELPEPAPPVGDSALVELLRRSDPEAWEREGAEIAITKSVLRVRHDAGRRQGVAAVVKNLRERFVRPIRLRTIVATVPLDAWANVVLGDGLEAALRDEGRGLVAMPGARVEGRASLRLLSGQRGGATTGVRRSYVGDYDVEIAEDARIGNPVVYDVLDGLSFGARPFLVSAEDAVSVDVRLDRSDWRGSRSVPTVHGAIECPSLGLLRFRGHRLVRLGSTVLLGAGVEGDHATLVLLSAAFDAP